MVRGDHSFAVGMLVSLAVHALGAGAVIHYARSGGRAPVVLTPRPTTQDAAIYIAEAPQDASALFGEATGRGEAANASPGEALMTGREAPQKQAFLSRDPVGAGHVGDDPSMSVLPRAAESVAMAPPAPSSMDEAAPFGMPAHADAATPPAQPSQSGPRVIASPPAPPAAGTDQTSLVRTKSAPVPMSENALASAGSAAPAADPAIMSDSESDPFAPGKAVDFRDGRVDVRLGRKVKTVRPRLSLADQYDLLAMQFPRLTVRVRIDREGAVRKVEIVKSTGSENADQAVKVALYQWWFEPKKDRSGRAVEDVVEFPMSFR